MGDFVFDIDTLAEYVGTYAGIFGYILAFALGFAAFLELLCFGIFKAFSLVDVKKY